MSWKREGEKEGDREMAKEDLTKRIKVWVVLGLKRFLSFSIVSLFMSLSSFFITGSSVVLMLSSELQH